ncbi:MAG: hypothetical protein HY800_07895 [Ignavibacteriales bacterium]|nr:hypothetical protein [Ignavibacteriales bacterium]
MAKKKKQKSGSRKLHQVKPSGSRNLQVAEKATTVNVTSAKGRPMLTWVGKRPLTQVTAFPAQLVETFDPEGNVIARSPEGTTKQSDSTRKVGLLRPDESRLAMIKGDIWTDWSSSYPQAGLLFHGDNKEVLAHLLANGFRGKVKLITTDPPFDSGADYVRKVSLRGAKGTTKLDGEWREGFSQ